jgi:murein DD-endopeptidase MepM/ murein hydrolase activator NlpD
MRMRRIAAAEERAQTLVGRVLPERTLTVRCPNGVRSHHISPLTQAAGLIAAIGVSAWLMAATGSLALQSIGEAAGGPGEVDLSATLETRIDALEQALAAAEAGRAGAEARARAAAAELAERHDALADAAARMQALEARSRAQEQTLAALTAERDAAAAAAETAAAARAEAEARLEASEIERAELSDTLMRVASVLDATAVARDDAQAAASEATGALGALASTVEVERDRQARVLAEVEKAAELSLAPLENMLRSAGVDVDSVIDKLRDSPGGSGGPFIPAAYGPAAEDPTASLAVGVIEDLERVRLLREAATRMPFAAPVRNPRFTSGFGHRRDPINRRAAMHEGLDMAGPRGTPIIAPASGVVTFAGTQRGYGRVVKIRHDFGFETVYAHLSRIRVAKGERVAPGERIGDMGNTGRSTGTHLHYEIRVNGKPVNPMKFIKAARDVL